MPVAPRPSNKAKKIAEAILGIPQNQPQKPTPKKKEKADQLEISDMFLRAKT